jgi:hypothetical protein
MNGQTLFGMRYKQGHFYGGTLAGIDHSSGGYPWPSGLIGAKLFTTEEESKAYVNSFPELESVKITLTIEEV